MGAPARARRAVRVAVRRRARRPGRPSTTAAPEAGWWSPACWCRRHRCRNADPLFDPPPLVDPPPPVDPPPVRPAAARPPPPLSDPPPFAVGAGAAGRGDAGVAVAPPLESARPAAPPEGGGGVVRGRAGGGRCRGRIGGGLGLACLLGALGFQDAAHALVLEALRLDLLEVNDLGLGRLLGLLEGVALALEGGLVVGHLRLHVLEVALGPAVAVERVGRRAGDRGGELVGHRLVGRRLGSLEQRQRSGARRHEAVDGDLVDRALQGVDLRLQLGLLAVQFVGLVAQAIELGLGVGHRGRGGVGVVASGLDLGGGAGGGVVAPVGPDRRDQGIGGSRHDEHETGERGEKSTAPDHRGQHSRCCSSVTIMTNASLPTLSGQPVRSMDDPSPLPLRLAGIRLVRGDTLILDGVDFTVEPRDPLARRRAERVRQDVAAAHRRAVRTPDGRDGRRPRRAPRSHRRPRAAPTRRRSCPPRWPTGFGRRSPPTTSCAPPASPRSSRGGTATARRTTSGRRSASPGWASSRLAGHEFGTLSSGERTRVLLARSLMNEPAIVLLDEPATGLDLAGREQFVAALSEFAADPDVTAVRHGQPPRRGRADQPHPRPAAARRPDARQRCRSTRC